MEWVEMTGKTVEEAKDAALERLGIHEDDAEFDVLADAKTGLFGRVKEEARVRARVRPTTPRSKDDRRRRRNGQGRGRGKGRGNGGGQGGERQERGRRSEGGTARDDHRQQRDASRQKPAREEQRSTNKQSSKASAQKEKPVENTETMPLSEQADIAQEFVGGLAELMGASVSFTRDELTEDEIRLTVTGEGIGRLIGPKGGASYALDEIVRTVLQRHAGSGRDGRVRIDMGGTRTRRAEALAAFSREQAALVRADGKARVLEPMGGSDRKVIHDTITDEDGVTTTSEGEDPYRRVVIVPAGDAD